MFCNPNTTGGFSICNVAEIGFNSHLKGWTCKDAKLVSIKQPAVDEIVSQSYIEGVSSKIELNTRLKFSISASDSAFELWLSACPTQDEQGFCSGRLNLSLPGTIPFGVVVAFLLLLFDLTCSVFLARWLRAVFLFYQIAKR
jgi:hypothetical protein